MATYVWRTERAKAGQDAVNRSLLQALENHLANARQRHPHSFVIATQRAASAIPQVIVNLFSTWYERLGFHGCSSHSGRRTFVTSTARQISTVGGSLRDVQVLAGHASLSTTQRYIEWDVHAQKRVVELFNRMTASELIGEIENSICTRRKPEVTGTISRFVWREFPPCAA
jgi:integrase